MNATQFDALLHQLRACSDTRKWAQGKSLQTVWETCERADWLLWLVGKMAGKQGWPTRKEIVLVACDCAEEALPFVAAGDNRPKQAIETARKCAEGKATIDEVRIAAYEAAVASAYAADSAAVYAAYAASAAASAAVYAAYAAAYAAYDDAAVLVVYAAYDDAAYAGVPQERLVEIVRKRIPVPFK